MASEKPQRAVSIAEMGKRQGENGKRKTAKFLLQSGTRLSHPVNSNFARSESRPLFLISQRILTTLLFAAIPENPAGRGHPEPGKKGEKGYEDH